VLVWGHCVGSALAIEVSRLIGLRGRPVEHLFLAAKLLSPEDEIRDTLANAEDLTFTDIRDWLAEWTGSTAFDVLGEGFQALLTRIFRHDSLSANGFLLRSREAGTVLADVPATVVMSDDDPVTGGYQSAFADWGLLVHDPSLHVVAGGGHYFTRTRPAEIAALVAERITG
jgi:surfactin synthase thioesterase subunit